MKVNIKPLSVNLAWQGKRFKTKAYKQYERDVLLLLRPVKMLEPPYEVYFKFYFSNPMSDLDNPVKLIMDILQKKYKFNDRHVMKLTVEKEVVKKGQECFEFLIMPYVS